YEVAARGGPTAATPAVDRSNERSATIFDARGRLAALSVGIPQFMLSSTLSVRFALDFFGPGGLPDGDVLIGHDPYHGGGQLSDYKVFAPVVVDGKLHFVVSVQCHHGDAGGPAARGRMSDALDIWKEGGRLPAVKVLERGVERADVIYLVKTNNRNPKFLSDFRAQIGAAQWGRNRL